jgi:hypothetical protein
MSTLAEEGLREINELSISSGNSFKVSVIELEDRSPAAEVQEKIIRKSIDMEAQMLALYQLAGLRAKKSNDIAQIQKIWERPLLVYEAAFTLVSNLISSGNRNPYIAHLLETISKLRDQVRWVYDLHGAE